MDHSDLFSSPGNFVNAPDGQPLFYWAHGDRSKPVIVWCYGLVCSNTHFKYQFEHFQNKAFNIFMDYRGHHCSPVPKNIDSVNVKQLAMDLMFVLDHLKIEEHSVVGHSL